MAITRPNPLKAAGQALLRRYFATCEKHEERMIVEKRGRI
jgi:hypothetical protein